LKVGVDSTPTLLDIDVITAWKSSSLPRTNPDGKLAVFNQKVKINTVSEGLKRTISFYRGKKLNETHSHENSFPAKTLITRIERVLCGASSFTITTRINDVAKGALQHINVFNN
jgi:hypothetical protein